DLSPEFKEKGIELLKTPEAAVYYIGFNMQDPVVGGDNKKLRQAMGLAFDTEWRIENFYNGRGISAQDPIPPGIFGHDADYDNPYKGPDLERARELLAEAGYPGGIGPDGKRLTITFDIGSAGPAAIQSAQRFAADMDQIGIAVDIQTNTWAEFLRKQRKGSTQVFRLGWLLDYPDPENFLQLLYGPNKAPGPNGTLYDNPEYNRLFEQMKAMPDTPERYEIIRRMVDIVVEDCVWIPIFHPVDYVLIHQWYENVKLQGTTGGYLKYRDANVELREKLRREWNRPAYGVLAAVLGPLLGISVILVFFTRREPEETYRP
ncbi:MAG: ABC transporter substrate-binding protein, partial [Candidatus Brocadiia bacterium]